MTHPPEKSKTKTFSLIRFVLFYMGLCTGFCIAWPPMIFYAIVSFGLLFATSPILAVDAFEFPVFRVPAMIASLTFAPCAVLMLRRVSTVMAFPYGIAVFTLCYMVFIATAEMSLSIAMRQEIIRNTIDCVVSRAFLAPRIFAAKVAIHSDERSYHDPHAVGLKGDRLYIWSFSETRFVPWHIAAAPDMTCAT